MDELDEKQLAGYVEKYPKFMEKYDARTQKGDIVQIEDDGHFTGKGRGYDDKNFALVIIKGKTKKDLQHLTGPLLEDHWALEFDEETMTSKAVYAPILRKKFKANVIGEKSEITESDIEVKVWQPL